MSEDKKDNGVDYDALARKFIGIARGLNESAELTLDQLLNIAKRDATWKSRTKSTDPEVIQGHFEELIGAVRRITSEQEDKE